MSHPGVDHGPVGIEEVEDEPEALALEDDSCPFCDGERHAHVMCPDYCPTCETDYVLGSCQGCSARRVALVVAQCLWRSREIEDYRAAGEQHPALRTLEVKV